MAIQYQLNNSTGWIWLLSEWQHLQSTLKIIKKSFIKDQVIELEADQDQEGDQTEEVDQDPIEDQDPREELDQNLEEDLGLREEVGQILEVNVDTFLNPRKERT